MIRNRTIALTFATALMALGALTITDTAQAVTCINDQGAAVECTPTPTATPTAEPVATCPYNTLVLGAGCLIPGPTPQCVEVTPDRTVCYSDVAPAIGITG